MATIAEMQKALELKKKSHTKTEDALEAASKVWQDLYDEQKPIENKIKAEKDKKKKKDLEKALADKKKEVLAAKAKLDALVKSCTEFEKTIAGLELEIGQAEKAVEVFGKARRDYMVWWNGAKGKLDGLMDQLKTKSEETEAAGEKAEQAVDGGNVELARSCSLKATQLAAACQQLNDQIDETVTSWGNGKWSEQRNLKLGGCEAGDVKQFDSVTKQVYATFREGDAARRLAEKYLNAALQAAEEAAILADSGAKTAEVYAKNLEVLAEKLNAKASKFNAIFTNVWGTAILESGARFKEEAKLVDRTNPTTVARAMKVAEQARSGMENLLASAKDIVDACNEMMTKETKKIPQELLRPNKPALDQARLLVIGLVNKYRQAEKLHPKALEEVANLEAAAGG